MTDIKSLANPLFLREEDLRQGIELLFFAYRDFTAERRILGVVGDAETAVAEDGQQLIITQPCSGR